MSVFNYNQSNSGLSNFSSNGLHQYQRPTNDTFRVNPLMFNSIRNLDVDKLEDDLAREIQKKKSI